MRRILTSIVLLVALLIAPPTTLAAGPGSIRADLEGTAIEANVVGRYFCHDRDYPLIHCYRSARALEADWDTPYAVSASLPVGTYVTIYSLPSYAGSYMYVTHNYDTLVWVGWNDRIRSYKAQNSAQGTFWTDWFATGTRLDFCCNAQVPIMSATFDQRITSVYRR